MSNNNFLKEKIISNIISLNPTGRLSFVDGTLKMNGPPSIIMTPIESAKQNLNNASAGKFICTKNEQKIENFENYNIEKKLEKKSNKNIIIYLVIILFLLLLIFFFIYKKRKI